MMNGKYGWLLAATLLLACGAGYAQEESNGEEENEAVGLPGPADDTARGASGVMENETAQYGLSVANEATMRVIDESEAGRPEAVTDHIPTPSEEELGSPGYETAGDQGVAAIEDARAVAADQAQDALNAAQEAIEQRGRGNPPDDLPVDPDVPEPPVNPTGD